MSEICRIYPAEGALCGEHYIELHGQRIGLIVMVGHEAVMNFYGCRLEPRDYEILSYAIKLYKESVTGAKTVSASNT